MAEEQKGKREERKWILEEEKRKLEEERRLLEKERRRREEEMWRREEKKRIQIKAEEKLKRAAVSEERPVQLQTEVEDDWYMLMGISLKDYSTYHGTLEMLDKNIDIFIYFTNVYSC